ncbi:mitochondrial carrier domain-containing protein, partial [Cadophora sp. MPI-SDFR-AT-0126]
MDIKPPLFGAELAEPVVMSKSSPLQQRKYRGFIAGIFSGAAKLTVGHPFDTIKVRMQTSTSTTFRTPLDCVVQTIRKEGVRGLYKGATPPLAGWMMMDSVMLGSLAVYRNFLHRTLFSPTRSSPFNSRNLDLIQSPESKLPVVGHGLAGILAGITVSFVAAPVEHLKARLQVQYSPIKASRFYQGPIDCMQKIVRSHGIPGLYHGLTATLIFRSFFFFWWSTYEIFTLQLRQRTTLSTPAINFWAGGLSAQVFWVCSYPS